MSIFARSIPSLTNFFQNFERTYAIVPGANVTADDSESLGSKLGFRLDLYTNMPAPLCGHYNDCVVV